MFDTADEQLTLGLGNDAIWQRFWEAVGDPDFARKPQYASNASRRENRVEIVQRIATILAGRPRDEWLALFARNRIPAGPLNRVDEVVNDPDLLETKFFYQSESSFGKIPQIGLGIAIDGKQDIHRKPPPALGEDTVTVLRDWLGKPEAEIAALKKSGVI